MLCPFAAWKPIINNQGPALTSILGLVVHVQQGNNSLQGYFSNPATQASSHFWISKSGILEQYVDTTVQAWTQAAGNSSYLSVECEGFDTEPMTAEQIDMCASLFDWICQTFMVPVQTTNHSGKGLTTHSFYPSGIPDPTWGNHPCPGSLRLPQLPSIIDQLTQPTEDNEVKFIFATDQKPTWIQSGDVVWQTSDISPYVTAGFVLIRVSPTDNDKIGAIAKAQSTGV